jgi:hypothetical protein
VALLSDFDWIILLAVGAVLFLGPQSGPILRRIGRYYGRAMRLKQELLAELTKEADLPFGANGPGFSLRGVLLGDEPAPAGPSAHVPIAVAQPFPSPGPAALRVTSTGTVGAVGAEDWSVAAPGPTLMGGDRR